MVWALGFRECCGIDIVFWDRLHQMLRSTAQSGSKSTNSYKFSFKGEGSEFTMGGHGTKN